LAQEVVTEALLLRMLTFEKKYFLRRYDLIWLAEPFELAGRQGEHARTVFERTGLEQQQQQQQQQQQRQ